MTLAVETSFGMRFNQRRQQLGLSCAQLGQRTGLSLRTIQRVLSGKEADPGFATVTLLAKALGVALRLDEEDINTLRLRQATEKADRLVALVQGTSALEEQGLSATTLQDLRQRTVRDLLAGSNRKLWSD